MTRPKKDITAYAKALCERHERKCITTKCPLHKYYCYDFPNFEALYTQSQMTVKRNISLTLHKLMKEEGWAYEQVQK